MKDLTPKDGAEAVATFSHAVIGPVCARELSRGDWLKCYVKSRAPVFVRRARGPKRTQCRRSSVGCMGIEEADSQHCGHLAATIEVASHGLRNFVTPSFARFPEAGRNANLHFIVFGADCLALHSSASLRQTRGVAVLRLGLRTPR
jgi:hypothetical protein